MPNQYYHAVFVGTGLISLTAAAALAKRGKRVLLLNIEDTNKDKIHDAGFGFSSGPLLYLGYEKWGAMEGYFLELLYSIPRLREKGFSFQKIAPMLQVVLPKHRISIFSDETSYFDELKREFPSQAQKLKTLFDQIAREAAYFYPTLGQFQQLEITGMAERMNHWKKQIDISQAILQQQKKKAIEMIEPLGFDPNVLAYFKLLFLFAFKKPMADVSAFEMIQFFSGLQRGGVRMCDGAPTLQNFFQDLIQNWGGDILQTQTVSKYEIDRKRVTHIKLSEGTIIKADHFVIAKPSGRVSLNFYFTIPIELIPYPMKPTLVMTWGEKPPKQVSDLLVIRLNKTDPSDTSEISDKRLIAVSILLHENISASNIDHKKLREKVLERLHWLIPFSESKIKTLDALENHRQTESYASLPSGASVGKTKEIMKGILDYFQPKKLKNVYLIDSHRSDYLGQGSIFLAGHRLAQFLENAK